MSAHHHSNEGLSRGARMLRTALGPAIARYLEDPAVVEVMLNPDGGRGSIGYAKDLSRPTKC